MSDYWEWLFFAASVAAGLGVIVAAALVPITDNEPPKSSR